MPEITTQTVRRDQCEPHPDNYNKHPASQVRKLRGSLDEFGQVQTVVLWAEEDADKSWILAGSGVWLAAHPCDAAEWDSDDDWLGIDELEARVCPESWSLAKALAYIAVDNESARLSDADEAQLSVIITIIHEESKQLAAIALADEGRVDALLLIGQQDAVAVERLAEIATEARLSVEAPLDDDSNEEAFAYTEDGLGGDSDSDDDESEEPAKKGKTREEREYKFNFQLDFDDAIVLEQALKQYEKSTGKSPDDWIMEMAGRHMRGEDTEEEAAEVS